MGANIANEVARDQFCESTVGGFGENAQVFKALFQRPTFRVSVSEGKNFFPRFKVYEKNKIQKLSSYVARSRTLSPAVPDSAMVLVWETTPKPPLFA